MSKNYIHLNQRDSYFHFHRPFYFSSSFFCSHCVFNFCEIDITYILHSSWCSIDCREFTFHSCLSLSFAFCFCTRLTFAAVLNLIIGIFVIILVDEKGKYKIRLNNVYNTNIWYRTNTHVNIRSSFEWKKQKSEKRCYCGEHTQK